MTNLTTFLDPGNISNAGDLLPYTNTVTNNSFGLLFLAGMWIIMFIAMKNFPTSQAFSAASFLCFILGIFFYIAEMISPYILIVFAIMSIGSFMATKKD